MYYTSPIRYSLAYYCGVLYSNSHIGRFGGIQINVMVAFASKAFGYFEASVAGVCTVTGALWRGPVQCYGGLRPLRYDIALLCVCFFKTRAAMEVLRVYLFVSLNYFLDDGLP